MMNETVPTRGARLPLALLLGSLLSTAAALPARAQSAQEVIDAALEKYEARMEGVENYTVVQEAMGFTTTTYFEKEVVDGHAVFRARAVMGQEMGQQDLTDPYEAFRKVAGTAEVKGKETVDGEESFVVYVPDIEKAMPSEDVQGDFSIEDGTFYLDTDDYVVRKMVMTGTQKQNGQEHPVTMTALFTDYRDVKGVLHPWRMEMSIEGFQTDISQEDMEEMREQMKELDEQMKNMPEAQRQMMEQMLKPQMERLQQMLASGAMDFTVTVKELKVNEGPPEGA